MVKRLVFGLLKGVVIGAALGALFHFALGLSTVGTVAGFLLSALAAVVAGVFSGQPPWKKGAWIGSILKAVFGMLLGSGLYFAISKLLGGVSVDGLLRTEGGTIATAPLAFMPMIAAVYSTFVEIDDGGETGTTADEPTSTGVRVGASEDAGEGEEVEVSASNAAKGAKKK